jgi:hypothetical protein
MKLLKGENRGQILVPSILAVVALFMTVILMLEVSNVMIEKIKAQNAADSAAVEAGLWYARSLNIVSVSNKILAVSAIAASVCEILGLKGAMKAVEMVQKVQDAFAGTGDFEKLPFEPVPGLLCAAVVRNGINNGAAAFPVFNIDSSEKALLPSFNLKRRYATELLMPEKDIPGKYSYKRKSDGKRIYVDKKDVRWDENLNHGKGGNITKKGRGLPSRILKEEKGLIPLDIIEKDKEHTVLVVLFMEKKGFIFRNGFFKQKEGALKKYFTATSMARVSGGNMDILDINAANYESKLTPVKLPQIDPDLIKTVESYMNIKDFNPDADLSAAADILREGVIIH